MAKLITDSIYGHSRGITFSSAGNKHMPKTSMLSRNKSDLTFGRFDLGPAIVLGSSQLQLDGGREKTQ
jgi:hypothetical protein